MLWKKYADTPYTRRLAKVSAVLTVALALLIVWLSVFLVRASYFEPDKSLFLKIWTAVFVPVMIGAVVWFRIWMLRDIREFCLWEQQDNEDEARMLEEFNRMMKGGLN